MNRLLIEPYLDELVPIPTGIWPTGKIEKPIRCVLFDIYGTLFISSAGDINLSNSDSNKSGKLAQLLKKFKLDMSPSAISDQFTSTIKEHHAQAKSRGIDFPEVDIRSIWSDILAPLGVQEKKAIEEFAIKYEWIHNPCLPMPGLKQCLDRLVNAGIKIGIISNAQFYTRFLFQWFLEKSLHDLGFSEDLVYLSYLNDHAKPSLIPFRLLEQNLKKNGIQNSDAVYVGNDMLNDIWTAQKVGFRTALFAGDMRSLRLRKDNYNCKNLNADLVLTQLNQLPSMIGILK